MKVPDAQHEQRRIAFIVDAMPGSWLDLSNELRDSAELLWSDHQNGLRVEARDVLGQDGVVKTLHSQYNTASRTYVLLAGFSLENALKGLLIARDPTLVHQAVLPAQLRSHDLPNLIAKVGDIILLPAERRFCEVASSALPYWGRYPVPLAFGGIVREVGITDELRLAFLSLQDRLGRALYMMIKDGWDSGVGPRSSAYWAMRYEDLDSRNDVGV